MNNYDIFQLAVGLLTLGVSVMIWKNETEKGSSLKRKLLMTALPIPLGLVNIVMALGLLP